VRGLPVRHLPVRRLNVSNRPRLRRPPNDIEAAFRDALRQGCPHCGSRRVVGQYRGGVWDFGLRCEAACRTFAEPQLAHRLAAEAARAASEAAGEKLSYRAVDACTGAVAGVVVGRAGGR
jgi:hypothetical protein